MKRKIGQTLLGYNDMPPKRQKTEEDIVTGKYNLIKATKDWTDKTFRIKNTRVKGDTLEEKAMEILRAQNIITTVTKAQLLTEDEKKTRLRKIIGDNGIDLFGEVTIQNQTLQWIGQCKMTKKLANSVANEMKGLLSTRPNTIGLIIYGGTKDSRIENIIMNTNSDIFLCHIEELHNIRDQIQLKYQKEGIRTMSMTRTFMEEVEEVEFDTEGRITKAKRVKSINIQTWNNTVIRGKEDKSINTLPQNPADN
jgi:hypothetical protein